MLDARQHALVICGLAGISAAALGWLVLGSTSLDRRLEPLQADAGRLGGYTVPVLTDGAQAAAAARSSPLFARPLSAGAPPLARLHGLSVRAGGRSALLSIGGMPAKWLRQGETSGQLTLVGVGSGSVVVETPDGRATLRLGESNDAAPPAPNMPGAQTPMVDQIPPGVRLPPPPASAPGV